MHNVAFGDVIQVDPTKNEMFGFCFVFVTEVRQWGIIGYIPAPDSKHYWLRLKWDHIHWCGQSTFATDLCQEEENGKDSQWVSLDPSE